ncbi:hypothetical protein D623_10021367 [Myotis brandtii]|uniref:Uncharacterized protein n=1 Tax=Myotis brandtii TaxID=109478 RepID=S7ND96_MYOBR|nr:hypothetical protein D623_10021367 [Myotis brandtii]
MTKVEDTRKTEVKANKRQVKQAESSLVTLMGLGPHPGQARWGEGICSSGSSRRFGCCQQNRDHLN